MSDADPISVQPVGHDAVITVDRALGDLRRGGMVVLAEPANAVSLILSAEYATAERLSRFAAMPGRSPALVLSAKRAAALGCPSAGASVVRLPLTEPLDANHAVMSLSNCTESTITVHPGPLIPLTAISSVLSP